MKARELAEFLLQHPDLDVVKSGPDDADGMYDDVYEPERITVSVVPRGYSWSKCPYFYYPVMADEAREVTGRPTKDVILIW